MVMVGTMVGTILNVIVDMDVVVVGVTTTMDVVDVVDVVEDTNHAKPFLAEQVVLCVVPLITLLKIAPIKVVVVVIIAMVEIASPTTMVVVEMVTLIVMGVTATPILTLHHHLPLLLGLAPFSPTSFTYPHTQFQTIQLTSLATTSPQPKTLSMTYTPLTIWLTQQPQLTSQIN